MPTIPELLNGHVTLEVECLDRLYLNGYIPALATPGGLVNFMRDQLGKPIPSPVVLGQVTEKFREAVKAMAEQKGIPLHAFDHKERKDDVANQIRKQRGVRDEVVFVGVAQEKAKTYQGRKVDSLYNGWKTTYGSDAQIARKLLGEDWVNKGSCVGQFAGEALASFFTHNCNR